MIIVNITTITETEVTNCFSKISDLKGDIQEILNRLFLTVVKPNSLKLSSRFDSFQKYTYSQIWHKNANNFMTKYFLTFKQFYLRAFRVYSLYLMSFLTIR